MLAVGALIALLIAMFVERPDVSSGAFWTLIGFILLAAHFAAVHYAAGRYTRG